MPGGFHPFHAGHYSLYKAAKEAFPGADVYVAATNDTKKRPFPFAIKEKLAKIAGVEPGRFVQVKSPFKADEITSQYDPNKDVLVFVRSEKDKSEQPKPGGTKKDGSPAYFQPYHPRHLQPFSKHAYIAYLPTVEFGPGIKSASEIREMWPTLSVKEKGKLVAQLYPNVLDKKQPAKLLANIVKMIDMGMGAGEELTEAVDSANGLERKVLDRLGARAGAPAGSSMEQVTDAFQQKLLNRMGKRFGLPPGATMDQVQAAQQAYLDKTDPGEAARYRQDMANIDSKYQKGMARINAQAAEDAKIQANLNAQRAALAKKGVTEGKMKPTKVTGKEKPGAVMALEKALLKAKNRGIKLNYDKIDKMMQLICKEFNLTGDSLHNKFVKKHDMIPDKWIAKNTIKESVTKSVDYLPEK
jgi:hypothetical protein